MVFNKRYNNVLNESQQNLISAFIKSDNDLLKERFNKIKESSLIKLDTYIKSCDNTIILEKYKNVKRNIESLDVDSCDKKNLQKFLTVSKLYEELLGE